MTARRSRRGPGLPGVPDFGGDLSRIQDRRVTEILSWARDNRQSWLLEFFDHRLAGATSPDPRAELVAAMTEAQLTAAHEALLLLCEAGRILFANQIAQSTLAERRWLVDHEGQLRGATPTIQVNFRRAIVAATGRSAADEAIHLRLIAPDDGEALLLRLAPLRLPGSATIARPFLTLHMLRDDAVPALDLASLTGWYGLSQAEARLAIAFANGTALGDYATENSITINTVRTLFARLKTKLGAADQAAVVRKVLRIAGQH